MENDICSSSFYKIFLIQAQTLHTAGPQAPPYATPVCTEVIKENKQLWFSSSFVLQYKKQKSKTENRPPRPLHLPPPLAAKTHQTLGHVTFPAAFFV